MNKQNSSKNFQKIISKLELEPAYPKVKVIKKSEKPAIEIIIKTEEINNMYSWILEKEDGSVDEGKFIASNLKKISAKIDEEYIKLEFNIPLNIEIGYHNFKVFNNSQNFLDIKLIVVPEKCFVPEIISRNKLIFGPKISLSNMNLSNGNASIKNIIKNLSTYGVDIIGIGPINQNSIDEDKAYNPYLPSNRMFFDTLLLNVEDMLNFVEDKELKVKFSSREFQIQNEGHEKDGPIDYKAIFETKLKKYKLLYEYFREHHIKPNTHKAQLFYSYIKETGQKLHKLALFKALRDFLSSGDEKYHLWTEWPKAYQDPKNKIISQFEKNNSESIDFYKFLLWQADIQIKEAGQTSYEKGLGIGLCTDFSFCIDPNAAEIWAYNEYFLQNGVIKIQSKNETEDCPALIPQKLIQCAYSYFIDLIQPNMLYSGALRLLNFEYIVNPLWEINNEETKKIFKIKYPIEDLLGIIALESQRNKCMIITEYSPLTEKNKQLLNKYGIFEEEKIHFEEINDEAQLEKYYEKLEEHHEKFIKQKDKISFNPIAKIPDSTYRLQFNKDFSFNDAKEIIPYLKKLGISHIYASPLLSPRKGSMHGYDVINYDEINQEAGTFEEFEAFVDTLHAYGLGLILDIVPNHMGIGAENKWWMDVLENGQSSKYSHYFDIDWKPIKKELRGKVLLPVLGDHYGNILANGEISFSLNREEGKLYTNYYEHKFPLNPSSYPSILEYRLDVLNARLGSMHKDLQEYLSIITVFKNLPKHTIIDYEKINERNREKQIAFERLSILCSNNYIIKGFIDENLIDFKCSPDNEISIERVHNLLEEQVYRLAFWRVSADEINYRRFFDINDLAAVCVEHPDVFTSTHSFILNLIENKKIDGLRIDHPDGLLEPVKYYKKLQTEIAKRIGEDFNPNEKNLLGSEKLPFYIVAEKILSPTEQIPQNWAIHGTVGYDFLNLVNGLFIKSENKNVFTDFYYNFLKTHLNFEEMVIECKKLIMNASLAAELNVLSNYLNQISEMYLFSRDYTLNSLRNALLELIACFPIYRTYVSEEEEAVTSKDSIKWAVNLARNRSLITDILIFDFIEQVLLLELEDDINSERYQAILNFTLKFQQYTGPLMAKGFEDTFFYRYNRMVSLNEVGGAPNKLGVSVEEFHQQNLNKSKSIPNSMLSSSTHDTKRSEDARSRINAISEFPQEWQKLVKKLHSINKLSQKNSYGLPAIDKNDEYLVYQSLIGIWEIEEFTGENVQNLEIRVENYILKAVKEAKAHTSWLNVNSEYEQAVSNFIKKIFNYPFGHSFWKTFLPFQNLISNIGYLNSISQCVLKLTSPGVPDIYQGSEMFKFTVVDPDNRNPVDYKKINEIYGLIQPLLNFNPETDNFELFKQILLPLSFNAIKLFYTATLLNFRTQNSNLFKLGKYIPLNVTGKNANHFIAFARLLENQAIIVVVPRLVLNLISPNASFQLNQEMIDDTIIEIPLELEKFSWTDILTKNKSKEFKEKFFIKDMLEFFPANVIYGNKS